MDPNAVIVINRQFLIGLVLAGYGVWLAPKVVALLESVSWQKEEPRKAPVVRRGRRRPELFVVGVGLMAVAAWMICR